VESTFDPAATAEDRHSEFMLTSLQGGNTLAQIAFPPTIELTFLDQVLTSAVSQRCIRIFERQVSVAPSPQHLDRPRLELRNLRANNLWISWVGVVEVMKCNMNT
jgi:hypothetical protein